LVCVPAAAWAGEVPRALLEAVGTQPELGTLLTDYTFRRSVMSTGRVLDRTLHEFLLSHPDIGASLVRVQGLGSYRVRRVAPGVFQGTDGEGASSVLRIVEEAPGRRVFHARGRHVARFAPDISGEALVLLTTWYEDAGDLELAHGHLTVYARLDNRLLGWVLRLLMPFIGSVLDAKIAKAFASESRAVKHSGLDPDTVLARLEEDAALSHADVAEFRSLLRDALARRPGAWAAARREAPDGSPTGPGRVQFDDWAIETATASNP